MTDLLAAATRILTQYVPNSTGAKRLMYLRRAAGYLGRLIAATPSSLPAIRLAPTMVDAVVSFPAVVPPLIPVTINGYQAVKSGSVGPVFVLVHGGPFPIGPEHVLSELAWRLASRGARAFAIDYRSETWGVAVADVEAAIAEVRAMAGGPITVVAHSFGGLPASIAVLRDAAADAYVAVCAISSAAGVGGAQAVGVPDPIALAARNPAMPVSVVRGARDVVASADDKDGFTLALHNAGHPGLNVLGPGDHSGTLLTDATLEAIFATTKLIA